MRRRAKGRPTNHLGDKVLATLRSASANPPHTLKIKAPKGGLVLTQHALIEGVHFNTAHLNPYDLGIRALNTSLFRLVAMGLRPQQVQVSCAAGPEQNQAFVEQVFNGVQSVADCHGVSLIGGNHYPSPTVFFLNFLACSRTARPAGKPRVGDRVSVTGLLGSAMAGLQAQRKMGQNARRDYPELLRAHACPSPPLEASLALGKRKSISTLAIVDGLAGELHLACRQWKVGVSLDPNRLPIHPQSFEVGRLLGMDVTKWALFGPEDYSLLICYPPKEHRRLEAHFKQYGTPLTPVGEITRRLGVHLQHTDEKEEELVERVWNPLVRHTL